MEPKYAQGDIVIVSTRDALTGKVVVPGIIRHIEQENPDSWHYEVNVFVDDGSSPADQANIHWWPLGEHEILGKVGEASVERLPEKPKGYYKFEGYRF